MPFDQHIAFIGAGSMTEALVAGLLTSSVTESKHLYATDVLPARREHMRARYGIRVSEDNREAAQCGDILVLSIEPQDVDDVLDEIRPSLREDALVVSVAAGYPIARVSAHVKPGMRIVRAMPNTPSTIRAGVTALAFGSNVSDAQRAIAQSLFEAVGKVVVVDEALMDAVTGLSGSGPAYIYVLIEALADGGVRMGLTRPVAELLAAQTVLGSARMLLESGESPGRLKDRITSPAGTTIAGIEQLEERQFRATLMSAVESATNRSRELGSSSWGDGCPAQANALDCCDHSFPFLCFPNRGAIVVYWVKVVFADNQELLINDAIRHTISDDMEVLEVDTAKEVTIIPMKQIKYISCDATVFATKPKA
jgi:pyrroline-5-carboxylate reductase